MRTVTLILALAPLLPLTAYSLTTESWSNGTKQLNLRHTFDAREIALQPTKIGTKKFTKFEVPHEGMNAAYAGLPDIPRLHRWFVVSPSVKYAAKTNFSNPITFKNILLYPSQPDPDDTGVTAPFKFDVKAYTKNKWYGEEKVQMHKTIRLGGATILPVTLLPAKYNPKKRELIVYQTIEVHLEMNDTEHEETVPVEGFSPFLAEQISLLTVNGNEYLQHVRAHVLPNKLLIVTTGDLLLHAKELGDLIRGETGTEVTIVALNPFVQSAQIKNMIQSQAHNNVLSHVLFFGDEKRIPLYQFSNGTYGDAWYSFISGFDEIADIGIGRVPVTDMDEAKQFIHKTRTYYAMKKKSANKRIQLIAHKEQYPGKYTGNMELVRKSENPLGLQFNLQYGGENATNATVIQEAQKGYAILNYRGHGSNVNWWTWGRDSASFALNHVDQLPNHEDGLSFIFNIACDNAAIQKSQQSLAEKQLFPVKDPTNLKGAIATIGATEASSTEVNHRFNYYLFQFLQTSAKKEIGNIYALSNNRLIKDSGGQMVKNVRMYLLLADPTLAPNVQ